MGNTKGFLCWCAVTALAGGATIGKAEATADRQSREIVGDAFAAYAVANRSEAAPKQPLFSTIEFPAQDARFVRLVVLRPSSGQVCVDELEIYGPDSPRNLALATAGSVPSASSALPGYAIHQVAHLNDGLYGNDHSWIAATDQEEWAEIELPAPTQVSRAVISRDRNGQFVDRQVLQAEVRVSLNRRDWTTVGKLTRSPAEFRPQKPPLTFPIGALSEPTWAGAVKYAFLCERDTWNRMDRKDYLSPFVNDRPAMPEGPMYWGRLVHLAPFERVLVQFEEMIDRLAAEGLSVQAERSELSALRDKARTAGAAESEALYLEARAAKRRLFLRDPRLAPVQQVLFAKRHPLEPSHNYSEHMDSMFVPGGGIYILRVPRDADGRLDPARGEVQRLFDGTEGIARDPVTDYEAQNIYFAFRPDKPEVEGWQPYWHLWTVRADGTGLRRMTDGPFHDFDPVPLPDGSLGFMSTRCHSRFLCWEPQAYVLHRMELDGTGLRRLSFANISEWNPVVMRDGRILWTRSEYQDKGADFGHTLWAIRPNGEHPELVFGNDTPYGYGHAREVPGSRELVCTIISHGDHQGPIALIDPERGRFNTAAITSITPDTRPQYQMDRSHHETFRDPEPISRDHFLVSHSPGPQSHWGIYIIDRYGNRELLYLDPAISSKRPTCLQPRPRPPLFPETRDLALAEKGLGQFTVQDVYAGLGSKVPRGRAKYLQVSQEVPAYLEKLACGEYRSTHSSFQDFYATPIHLVTGKTETYTTETVNALNPHAFRTGSATPVAGGAAITENNGWPSYVAKAVLGTVPIAQDGSVNFTAPAEKVLYFQLLDENFNEIQRMRSVVHLQTGERRSCVGCHDDRAAAPGQFAREEMNRPGQPLDPPPWGAQPFDYERVVQPVLDAHCVSCHAPQSTTDAARAKAAKLDLRGTRDADRVPASYRTLITGGYVHYFDWSYGSRHFKADPGTFGTVRSRLFEALRKEQHAEVKLARDEERALKAWVDLNCPLWPDYRYRKDRPL